MRALPNMTVVYPGDANEMRQAVSAVVEATGPMYLRLYREATPMFTQESDVFELGKARVVREGSDVTIVATGPQTAFALEAAKQLQDDGIDAEVINVHTIQPLDIETITASAAKTKRVVTAEDHNVNGGLGSAVAEALSEHQPTWLWRVAVRQFGESGKYTELIAKLEIDGAGIAKAVRDLLE